MASKPSEVSDAAARYGIDLANLDPRNRIKILLLEMRLRWRKQVLAMLLVVLAIGCAFTLAFLAYQRSQPAPDRGADRRVIEYMQQILILRGEFEARNPGWSEHVRREGLELARRIGSVEPSKLRPARKIVQHEYKGWVLLMVARSYDKEAHEPGAARYRIEYARQATGEFNSALDLMQEITLRFISGPTDDETRGLYLWITGESGDLDRTHYLKAVAFAVIARAGGAKTKADVLGELAHVSPTYRVNYPPENNPDLKWALGR